MRGGVGSDGLGEGLAGGKRIQGMNYQKKCKAGIPDRQAPERAWLPTAPIFSMAC
jgi:hypothetical protein